MIIFKNEVKCNKNLLPRVNLELLTSFIAADFQVFGVFRNPQAGRQGFLLGGVKPAFLVNRGQILRAFS